MENKIDIEELREQQAFNWQKFLDTGSFYYYLIAQELSKTIEIKLENDKNLEEEQGLGL